MMSKGGIPSRTTVCATLAPGNGTTDDSTRIQTALDSCAAGQVVQLNAGTFVVNNLLMVRLLDYAARRGSRLHLSEKDQRRPWPDHDGGERHRWAFSPLSIPSTYTYDTQPVVIVGPSRWPGPDNSTSQALTSDGQQGAKSVTIANASGFAAGQFVLLDEKSGASWQPTPTGFPGRLPSVGGRPCRLEHAFPVSPGDDNGNSNASGPYDSTPALCRPQCRGSRGPTGRRTRSRRSPPSPATRSRSHPR